MDNHNWAEYKFTEPYIWERQLSFWACHYCKGLARRYLANGDVAVRCEHCGTLAYWIDCIDMFNRDGYGGEYDGSRFERVGGKVVRVYDWGGGVGSNVPPPTMDDAMALDDIDLEPLAPDINEMSLTRPGVFLRIWKKLKGE